MDDFRESSTERSIFAVYTKLKDLYGVKVQYSNAEVAEVISRLNVEQKNCQLVYAAFLGESEFLSIFTELRVDDYLHLRRKALGGGMNGARPSGVRFISVLYAACVLFLMAVGVVVVWMGVAWGGHYFLIFPLLLLFFAWLFIQNKKSRDP